MVFSNNKIIFDILKEFGFENNIELEKLIIYSQSELFVGKKKVIPDIILEYNKKKTIIEVKIDSKLNLYYLDKKTIYQLELYSKLDNVVSVYLLTKRIILIDTLKNVKIRKDFVDCNS